MSTPTYAEALAELEAIVAGLESGDLDVDGLAEKVTRATELVKLCRERLANARLEVERIVTDLDDTAE